MICLRATLWERREGEEEGNCTRPKVVEKRERGRGGRGLETWQSKGWIKIKRKWRSFNERGREGRRNGRMNCVEKVKFWREEGKEWMGWLNFWPRRREVREDKEYKKGSTGWLNALPNVKSVRIEGRLWIGWLTKSPKWREVREGGNWIGRLKKPRSLKWRDWSEDERARMGLEILPEI